MIDFPTFDKSFLKENPNSCFRIKFQITCSPIVIVNGKPSLSLRIRDAIVFPIENRMNIKLGKSVVTPIKHRENAYTKFIQENFSSTAGSHPERMKVLASSLE